MGGRQPDGVSLEWTASAAGGSVISVSGVEVWQEGSSRSGS